jgi:translation initiation factor 3 subunit F
LKLSHYGFANLQVAVDIDYHRTMFELHQRVNSKEVIIGWYASLTS